MRFSDGIKQNSWKTYRRSVLGLFDFLKKDKSNDKKRVMGMGYYPPIYTQFGSDIYSSDVVQQAIQCIVQEMKKLSPQHKIKKGSLATEQINDDIQSVLDNPNPLMTTSEFIEKIVWQLYFNYNSFVLPVWVNGKLSALYPLQPINVDFIQDNSNTMFVKLVFNNQYECTIPYADIIHIRYKYSVSEFMGGNVDGQPDNKALLQTLELNKTLLEGVAKGLKSSFAINGVIKYNSFIDNGKTEQALQDLTDRLNANENGFLPLDMKGEFIPFKREIQLVDEATLKFIDEKILRHFGVPLPILTGDFTKEQYEAFFQKTLEPLIIAMSQAFTKAIFSKRKSFGYGHFIEFNHKELSFMTINEKIQWVTTASSVGAITINEIRNIFGYPPSNEPNANKLIMSKNYGSVDSVANMDIDKNENQNNNASDSEVQNEE